MIDNFNGVAVTGKVCKNSVKKFDKFTAFDLFVREKDKDGKFYHCKVFKKVKEFFDSAVKDGDTLTVQATQSVRTYNDKTYVDYLVCYFDKK